MTLKIESKTLRDYLNLITVKGRILEILLNFTEKGISSDSIFEGNIGATFATLNKESFEQYEIEDTEVGIKNSLLLLNILTTFEGKVNLEVSENVLKIYNEVKTAHIVLMKPEFIVTVFPAQQKEKLLSKFVNEKELPITILKNSVVDSNILKSSNFNLSCKDRILTITTGESGFDKITETCPFEYNDFSSNYDSILGDVIEVLPNKVLFDIIGDNAPCMFTIKNSSYSCKIMLAPLANNE